MLNIIYKPLFLPEYQKYKGNINLMNTMVFEEQYFFLHGNKAPYDGYDADNVLSPNCKHHGEYFRQYKPKAIELLNQWEETLSAYLDDTGKRRLEQMHGDMKDAQDFVDLVWIATALLNSVYEYRAMLRQRE